MPVLAFYCLYHERITVSALFMSTVKGWCKYGRCTQIQPPRIVSTGSICYKAALTSRLCHPEPVPCPASPAARF